MSWLEEHWLEILAMGPIAAPVKLCKVEGCERERRAKGLCMNHYNLARTRYDSEAKARKLAHERRRRAERREQEGGPPSGYPVPNPGEHLGDALAGAPGQGAEGHS